MTFEAIPYKAGPSTSAERKSLSKVNIKKGFLFGKRGWIIVTSSTTN